MTCDLTVTELQTFILAPMEVPKFPLHTQAVERFIRRVDAASLKVISFNIKISIP